MIQLGQLKAHRMLPRHSNHRCITAGGSLSLYIKCHWLADAQLTALHKPINIYEIIRIQAARTKSTCRRPFISVLLHTHSIIKHGETRPSFLPSFHFSPFRRPQLSSDTSGVSINHTFNNTHQLVQCMEQEELCVIQ